MAGYDLVIASQPYRARASVEFKATKVIAPLARALGPGGRLVGIHSCGRDPGLEIVRKIWPEETPFATGRHDLLRAVRTDLGYDAISYWYRGTSGMSAKAPDATTVPGMPAPVAVISVKPSRSGRARKASLWATLWRTGRWPVRAHSALWSQINFKNFRLA